MTSIPNDLIEEICTRLPSKSIARFRCVSKQWCSMLHRPDFTELFLTRSSARPRLLFAIEGKDEWSFFSMTQPHNPYKKSSSLVVAADFHMTFPSGRGLMSCFPGYASGLICLTQMPFLNKEVTSSIICNPNTGQYSILPIPIKHTYMRPFLGFDPIDKQFKVLFIKDDTSYYDDAGPRILTLGAEKMRLRKIQCPLTHWPLFPKGICINGVLYYIAETKDTRVIVCFYVRSEEFKFIDVEYFSFLGIKWINFKGIFGLTKWVPDAAELRLSVLEDVEEEEWTEYLCTLRDGMIVDQLTASALRVVGVTATGEIVLSKLCLSKPFYVFFVRPGRSSTLQRVEIQGIGDYNVENSNDHFVEFFVDHVEDLNLNDVKYLKSSEGLNSIRKMPKLQHMEEVGERDRDMS
ncbi:unnamed protein product [Microthlaspi erraticum]|uniref:F-box domain-containing protein n=1 Tax=Microthlaspi erraticum TaxID=1685480 RepID=A0A6D2L972_9BRAS|nr:unnamed protein product [Microthlaspi erraticum]